VNELAGFLAALKEGTVAERRIFADWLEKHGEAAEAARQRILGEEPYCNALGMEFVHLPPGTFWMGGYDGTCGTRQVRIERDFYIGIYPVTQAEWTEVMGSNPSHFQKGKGGADKLTGVFDTDLNRFPIESVNWDDCQKFQNQLNEKCKENGRMYRSTSEAEIKYTFRGGIFFPKNCSWRY
jgi:formylglycine-generating enzyme required for sulfatase activity